MVCNNAEEEKALTAFIHLEIECDDYNERQMRLCDTSHLGKGMIKKIDAAPKRWDKDNSRNLKSIALRQKLTPALRYRLTQKERTWLTKV